MEVTVCLYLWTALLAKFEVLQYLEYYRHISCGQGQRLKFLKYMCLVYLTLPYIVSPCAMMIDMCLS